MRRLPPTLSLLLAIALIAASVQAKNAGRITGKITSQAGEGLIGAVITLFRQDGEGGTITFTRSDRKGLFRISGLAPGSYHLQVAREGYQPLTNSGIKIEPGKTLTLNVVLQELLDFLAAEPDPRNWDLRTVVRSTSDRRLIFRDLPGSAAERESTFTRGAALEVATTSGMAGENYFVSPSSDRNGVVSNFAYTEPITDSGRMIVSGQLNSGADSFWHVRNTFHYRTDPGRDLKLSLGYGRLGLNNTDISLLSKPAHFLNQDPAMRDSGAQFFDLGLGGRSQILDGLEIEYGFDLSRVYYGTSKTYFSPYFQVVVTPADTWKVKTAMSSRRVRDANTILLPDGEPLNMTEPVYVAKIDGRLHVSQFKHSEIALERILSGRATVEVALYEDHMNGSGMPFLVAAVTPSGSNTVVAQLRESQTAQRGMRLAVNRNILDFLAGSIVYVYGTGTALSANGGTLSGEQLAQRLLEFMQRSYYHSVSGRVQANFRRTRTNMTAAVRWYPGDPLTPVDLFADRSDMLSKGVNLSIRQQLPLPEILGSVGRWEALVDVRNMFENGNARVRTSDGQLVLSRNPRSLRFGINLNLY
ncbi:MAG: carboxypeptidase regulatory-like domain-containing protein [Acidobacteria bacterium]|nr:carboxypeptidase regulatory-like domain-containing protein [Acidobacteriota bacterium]